MQEPYGIQLLLAASPRISCLADPRKKEVRGDASGFPASVTRSEILLQALSALQVNYPTGREQWMYEFTTREVDI